MNCREGDLALVVGGPRQNLGRQISCVRLLSSSDRVPDPGMAETFIRPDPADAEPIWLVSDPLWVVVTNGARARNALIPMCPDRWLMPIRPEPDSEPVGISDEVSA